MYDQAAGSSADLDDAVAVVEVAAGLWSRAFMSAEVSGDRYNILTPSILGSIARELCLVGEYVAALEVDDDHLVMLPAVVDEVLGGPLPSSWRYRVELVGPSSTRTVSRAANAIVHARYGSRSSEPWRGCAPWAAAKVDRDLLANLTGRLKEESRTRAGYLLPYSVDPSDHDDDEDDPLLGVKSVLRNQTGGTALVETLAGGLGDRANAPQEDWRPRRLGADPPQALGTLIDAVGYRLLAAAGIPVSLVRGVDGTSMREGFRQFLHSCVVPVSRLVEAELSEKLDAEIRLGFDSLFAADVQGRSRALGSMTTAGIPLEEARRLAGL